MSDKTTSRPEKLIADAIWGTLQTPNETDSNWEPAGVVDGLYFIGRAIFKLAEAVERLAPSEPQPPEEKPF